MKKYLSGILSFILMVFIIPMVIVNADVSMDTDVDSVNVAMNKDVSFRSIDMETVLYQRPFVNAQDPLPDNLITEEVDAYDYLRFDNSVYLSEEASGSGESKLGWAVIDLGEDYIISGVGLQLWNDWSFSDVVVQVSDNVDFNDYLTVYSNDNDDSLGFGTGRGGEYKDYFQDLQLFNFNSMQARYIRVTNNAKNEGYTLFSRIEVYGNTVNMAPEQPKEVAPVLPNVLSGIYGNHFDLSLTTVYEEATIYYTADGTYPTTASAVYTEPINTETLGSDILIRAIVETADGVISLPVRFTYQIADPDVGKNVAGGLTPQFMNFDFTEEIAYGGFNGAADNPALVTDGSFDPGSSCIATEGIGWAVLDFGKEYPIGKIVYSAWHDWWFGDTIIELALNSDFSDAVTVYNNSDGVQNVPNTGSEYTLTTPVAARYLRVTNNAKGEGENSIFTEIQAIVGEVGYVTPDTNIVFNTDNISAVGLDGTELTTRKHEANSANDGTLRAIVDGDISSWGAVETVDGTGNPVPGWIYFDFGVNCYINQINVSFWHDWSFRDIVIQLSTSPDFSTGVVTVYNNDIDDSLGLGLPTVSLDNNIPHDVEYISNHGDLGSTIDGNGLIWRFSTVESRYLRVITGGNQAGDYSIYTEIQAITAEPARELEESIIAVSGVEHRQVVANGSTIDDVLADLPGLLQIVDFAGNEYTINGTWISPDFSNDLENGETEAGEYAFTFVPADLPENVVDVYDLLTITVVVETTADTDDLAATIAAAGELDLDLYTLTTATNLQEKLDAANAVMAMAIKTQEEVNAANSELTQAIATLELRGDTALLADLFDQLQDIDANLYTGSSYAEFVIYCDAAEAALLPVGNADLNQEEVDALTADLENSYAGLVIRATEAEITAITDLYQNVKALLNGAEAHLYTLTSFENLTTLVADLNRYEDMENTETDLAQTVYQADFALLSDAELMERGDTTQLKEAYEEYLETYGDGDDNIDDYLLPTWALYLSKMETAGEILYIDGDDHTLNGNANLNQDAVDTALAELTAAVAGLTLCGDKGDLKDLLVLVEDLSEEDYTTDTFEAFRQALLAAQNIDAKDDALTTQEEIDTVYADLNAAYEQLVEKGDKSELIAKINETAAVLASDYTASSYNAFKDAFDAAQAVNDEVDAVQADIDAALTALTEKFDSLIEIGNKTELYNIIHDAEQLNKDDYNEANWEEFLEMLEYAQSVADSNDVSQDDVDTACENLQGAIDALQDDKKGCFGSVIMNAFSGLALLGVLFIIRKRRY